MANSVWAAKGPLGNRNFRLILGGAAIGHLLMPLQFVTQILWVQAHAPKDVWLILVALIGASRGVGALTFGLYGGALADRFDRRKLLMTTQALLVVMTIGITGLMLGSEGGTVGFVLFFLLTFLSAGLQSIDMPTRLAIVPDILGRFSQQSLVVLDRVFLTDKGFAEDIESRLNRFFGFHENSSENNNLTLIYHRDYREH